MLPQTSNGRPYNTDGVLKYPEVMPQGLDTKRAIDCSIHEKGDWLQQYDGDCLCTTAFSEEASL